MSENIQVPQGWEVKKLGEVVEINKLTLKDNTDPNYKFTYIDLSSVNKGNIILSSEELFFKNAPSRARRIIKEDNIIIATVRPNLQGFAYIDFPCKDYIVSTGFAVLSYKNNIYMKFLYNMFYSNILMGQINAIITGSNYPAINSNDIKNFTIPVPPLEEQKKIAEILSLWDKAIEQTKDLIAYKEKQKKGLMQALLTGKKRLNGFTDEWKTYQLGECFKNFGGAPLEKYMDIAGKYKFISIGNYSTHGKYIDNGNRVILNDITQTKLLNKNDLVMVLNDKTADGKIIGATILIDEDNTYIYNQRSERLVCNKNVFPLFFWFLLNSELIRKEIFAMAQGGTQIYINFSSIKSINIFLPPLNEQKAIADILSSADEEINLLNKQLELYTEQKKGLMQNLLTGKVRV